MRRIKKILSINLFYLIAFTVTILLFSIGNSIVQNEERVAQKYVSGSVQSIYINSSYNIRLKDVEEIIKKYTLSFWATFSDNESGALISTKLIENEFQIIPKLKEGRNFSRDEWKEESGIAIKSSANKSEENFEILALDNKKFKHKVVGSYYGLINEVFIPNKGFFEMIGDDIITNKPLLLWVGGDQKEIEKCVLEIKGYVEKKDNKSSVEAIKSDSYVPRSQGNIFSKASFNIILIAFINSLTLSTLWIDKRKKELSLRKAIGATEEDLSKLFLKDLSVVSCMASILAMMVYCIIIKITNGSIFNLNIYPVISSIVLALIITFGTSYIVSVYLLGKLKKLEAADALRGD